MTGERDPPCAAAHASIPDKSIFALLRDSYCKAKAKSDKEDAGVQAIQACQENTYVTGSYIPFDIRVGPHGRGLFTTCFVAKGTKVWGCELYGTFQTREEWEDFLSGLPENLHEDVFIWSYVLKDGDSYVVAVDMDEASLMNHGSTRVACDGSVLPPGESIAPNSIEVIYDGNDGKYYYVASRDMQAGEEILADYSDFHEYQHNLDWWWDLCKLRNVSHLQPQLNDVDKDMGIPSVVSSQDSSEDIRADYGREIWQKRATAE